MRSNSHGFSLKPFAKLSLALALSSILVGCNHSSSDDDHSDDAHNNEQDHGDTHVETSGRLAVLNSADNSVNIINIDDQQSLGSFALGSAGARLHASPEYRYALALERDANRVSIFDSGLYTEDHGDHLHDYQEAPADTGIVLNGSRPTHFSVHEEYGAVFNDAGDGVMSSVTLLSDEWITGQNNLLTLELTNSMHGVAKLIDDKLFVTYRDLTITDTTLPAEVERYSFDGTGFTLDSRYSTQCPLLHGAGTSENYLIYGCGDGILSINLQDSEYPATHYSNPDFFGDDERIGSVYGHHEVNDLIGTVGYPHRQLMRLSPDAEQPIQALTLPDNDLAIAQGFNQDGDTFYALSPDGQLHFFNTSDWTLSSSLQVVNALAEDATTPVIVSSQADGHLYLLDPENQRILVIDSEEGSVEETIALDFPASTLVWLGLSAEHGHEH